MSFLYPTFLWASFAVAIPIILHFFNLKSYQTVYFSNIALLRKVQDTSRARAQLKHLIVLLLRVLAILAMVFLFAQPQRHAVVQQANAGVERVAVYLDNSFSMQALGAQGQLLEVAKNKVRSIVAAYPSNAEFTLITNDLELQHQGFLSGSQLIAQTAALQVSPVVLPLSQVAKQTQQRLAQESIKTLFVLGDLQRSSTDWPQIEPDSTLRLRLVPVYSQQLGNVVVDSAWFEQPSHILGADETLYARITNRSDNAFDNLPINLDINGHLRSVVNLRLPERASETVALNFTNRQQGFQQATVRIEDYPVSFDNLFHLTFLVENSIPMLVVNPADSVAHFSALARSSSLLAMQQVSATALNVSQLPAYKVLVLNGIEQLASGTEEALRLFVEQGGSLVVAPSASTHLYPWLQRLGAPTLLPRDTAPIEIDPRSLQHPFFDQSLQRTEAPLQLPPVRDRYRLAAKLPGWEPLLTDRFEQPLLLRGKLGQGAVFLFTFPLHARQQSFLLHPLFATVMLSIPLQSVGQSVQSYTIGQSPTILLQATLAGKEQVLKLSSTDGQFSIAPTWHSVPGTRQISLQQTNRILTHGFYLLQQADNTVAQLAFNYNRTESLLDTWQPSDLQQNEALAQFTDWQIFDAENTATLTQSIRDQQHGNSLWRYFAVAALLFVLAEVAVLRFWR